MRQQLKMNLMTNLTMNLKTQTSEPLCQRVSALLMFALSSLAMTRNGYANLASAYLALHVWLLANV
jgi:hypothetical protein